MKKEDKGKIIQELSGKFAQFNYFYITDASGMTTQQIELTRVSVPGDPLAFFRRAEASITLCRSRCAPVTQITEGSLRVGNRVRVAGIDASITSMGLFSFSKRGFLIPENPGAKLLLTIMTL